MVERGTHPVDLKRTPLFPLYAEFGAKTIEFGGWDMPVQFSSILQEHEAVRTRVGLFDVSHMGEFEVVGSDARSFIQRMVTNDVNKLEPGMAMYSPMTYDHGGCVDDLLVYCFDDSKFWIVVNAGNIDKDYAWLESHKGSFDVSLTNRSDDTALLAVQGPMAEAVLKTLTPVDVSSIRYYRFLEGEVAGVPVIISRTGYTGEDGFELYAAAKDAQTLWRALLDAGRDFGILPCGLGCRDTLRLEARLPLYGHELTEHITPLEAGLGMFVKLDKGDFIGREALAKQKADGVTRKIVGVQLLDRGIPRQDYRLYADGQEVGYFTSGTMSPTLKIPIGLALIDVSKAAIGTQLEADIRGKRVRAEVVKTPFYKRSSSN
jgi:aminomethyltransferase